MIAEEISAPGSGGEPSAGDISISGEACWFASRHARSIKRGKNPLTFISPGEGKSALAILLTPSVLASGERAASK